MGLSSANRLDVDAIVHVLRDIRSATYRPSAPIVEGLAEARERLLSETTVSASGAAS